MTSRREKQVGRLKGKKALKIRGAPREQRRAWQVSNGKSWSRRPQRKRDGWL